MIRFCPECGAKLKGKLITTHRVFLTDEGSVTQPEPLGEEFWEIECENGHVLTPGRIRAKEESNGRGQEDE